MKQQVLMDKLQQVVQKSKIINESGYTKQQIFSIDKTAFSWKMMPSRTFIAREEKSLLGFKGQDDLLGANAAAGASKLKSLLIYNFENLRSLKNYAKSTLPLLYKWSNKPGLQPMCLQKFTEYRASLVARLVKNPPAMQETWVQSLGWEDPLEKGKATHSSILA